MDRIRKKEGFEEERLFVLPEYTLAELAQHTLTKSLYVTDIGYFPRAKYHYRERPDGCDSHIVIFCVSGEGWVELIGDRTYTIRKQTMLFLPAGVPHRYGTVDENPWSIYWFHAKGDEVLPLFEAFRLHNGSVPFPLGYTMKLGETFEQIYRLLLDKPYSLPAHIHIAQMIRQQISALGIASGGSPQEQKRARYIDQAISYMADRLDSTMKLDDLAGHIGLSKPHLIELFNEATGFPPIDYFLRMKMQRASQLLDLTDLSIKEISGMLGIQDPYYFSRMFKKIIGISPTAYRSIQKG